MSVGGVVYLVVAVLSVPVMGYLIHRFMAPLADSPTISTVADGFYMLFLAALWPFVYGALAIAGLLWCVGRTIRS